MHATGRGDRADMAGIEKVPVFQVFRSLKREYSG